MLRHFAPQIMVAVERGERPEVQPAEELAGGVFVGLPHFVRLMRACWAQLPHERPPVEEVRTVPLAYPVSRGDMLPLCMLGLAGSVM